MNGISNNRSTVGEFRSQKKDSSIPHGYAGFFLLYAPKLRNNDFFLQKWEKINIFRKIGNIERWTLSNLFLVDLSELPVVKTAVEL